MKRRLPAAVLIPGAAVLIMVWGCPAVSPPASECAAAGAACTSTDDCCEGLTCTDSVCTESPPENAAAIPAKTISLNLMAIHDPDSDAYIGNCIGCHGDRTDEVALDGVTPAAHAIMADFFGEGNDRCIACHENGPNFYDFRMGFGTLSRGGLREQVDMEAAGCTGCHAAGASVPLYAR